MFSLDKTDFQRFAVSAMGALALTAASVVAATAPAKAAGHEVQRDSQAASIETNNGMTFAAR